MEASKGRLERRRGKANDSSRRAERERTELSEKDLLKKVAIDRRAERAWIAMTEVSSLS